MQNTKNRLSQISNIRALAILLVVLGHSIILYSHGWNLYETTRSSQFLDVLKQIIDVFQMPLFFSLSGYLFVFTHQKKGGIVHLLKNKSIRLLIPYIVVGVFYMLPIRLLVDYPGYREKSALDILKGFLMGTDVGHLWFLPSLFLVFLLAELILKFAEMIPSFTKHSELVLVCIAAILYLEGYRIGFGYPPLLSAFQYLLWFSVGYFLCRHRDMVKQLYRNKIVKYSLLLLNVGLAIYCYCEPNSRVLIMLGTRALYILNAYGVIPEKNIPLAQKLDRNSFGIYLFHSPLIYITFTMMPNALPALVVFINLVIFGAAAYGLTNLVRRWKLGFVIGE